mmetsp:Transcript_31940/g.49005  ORF Transcript_31940/g.49005 Transcript_31940/m.49005 type:complete len:294 (+) Transcript_31940:104-985(+)|eukprot:CAMPEP_0195304082 /NCGR_PEP_ID=MMETSP0707-20130614/33815_1 /TAXON_ID=33640 /ORGANISM="Asterionellopsis glacialis, Strain CCMP134" /LENGTH=293 /DNA_ID=CAMNT_0040367795 /DNA_START=88 /DNA_END=969 /DNA_ORIENTATION=+
MGNAGSQPTNRTGKKVVAQKLETAKKTGILSLTEHKLDSIPGQVFQIPNLRTLDVSKNNLKDLSYLSQLKALKSLNCDDNKLAAGTLDAVSELSKLQNLSAGGNQIGKPIPVGAAAASPKKNKKTTTILPELPPSLKQLKLDRNHLSSIPRQLVSVKLRKLEKMDLSGNNLAAIPVEISNLIALTELNLDNNSVVSLPDSIGSLTKLKVLSLKNNHIHVTKGVVHSTSNPQPLPRSLFVDTPIIDLNLHGNRMTSTQLNEFDGYPEFLERRQKVKSKDIYGGALTNLDVCGLE